MIENKVVVPVEKVAAGGRESARDYDLRPAPLRQSKPGGKAFPQSTAAVDNFVGKLGAGARTGRQIKALDNLPPF